VTDRKLRVLDIGTGQAGAVAAMLLADMGAEVIRFDIGGLPPADGRDAIWNRWKRRVAVTEAELAEALRLEAPRADVIVTDLNRAARARVGLDLDALMAAHPGLIVATVGGWPQGHAREDGPVDDAIVLAEAGLCDEMMAVTRDGPIYVRFPLGSCSAAWLALIGILARLWVRRRDGVGGRVSTSLVQGAMVPHMQNWGRTELTTPAVAGISKAWASTGVYRAGDGAWFHSMGDILKSPTLKAALAALSPQEITQAQARHARPGRDYRRADYGAICEIFATRPRQFWLEEYWAAGAPVQPCLPMGSLFDDEQVLANAYAIPVEDPRLGPTMQPGIPYHIEPAAPSEAAFGGAAAVLAPAPGAPPLAGLRVLDFGAFLAGPLGPMIMADLGADVIKVEPPRGEQMRASAEWSVLGCQRGKRGLALDLKNPRAAPIIEALIRSSHVVHHNMRLPAAERLGLGYAAVRAINPAVVYTHTSSYGPKGPRRDWPGFDQLFQAASGWELAGAGEGNGAVWHRFGMMDHYCAMASVAGTLLALLRSAGSGQGQATAASLLGAAHLTAETVQLADGTLTPWAPLDRAQMGVSPVRRLYATTDGWVMVAAPERDTEALARLKAAAAATDLEARFASLTAAQAIALAETAGIPAAKVALDNRDPYLDDPENRRTQLSIRHDHPTFGHFDHPGKFIDFADLPNRFVRPPPTIGQHTREILAELGLDAPAIDALAAEGVVAA
jgi:crotonobetainyl-CoA:carnitine CoA-transferase CaiB-like acyl-CoA transferase